MERIKKIRIYGDDNEGIETAPKAYEPPTEVQIRQKNFKVLTVISYVLLFLLISQSSIFILYRIMLEKPLFMDTFPLIITIIVLLTAFVLYICEKHTYHSLSYINMIALIFGETVTIIGMFLLYNFDIPWLLNATFIFSIIFAIYIYLYF